MIAVLADLHIHTRLSPCASDEMTSTAIVRQAVQVGLQWIAICDHNSALNVNSVIEAARGSPLQVIAGIEIETQEGIHLVGLFPRPSRVLEVSRIIRETLPDIDAEYTRKYGEQILLDREGKPCGQEVKALARPSSLALRPAVELIKTHDGLAFAAHIERPSFSVYSQLGDVPRDIPFDALEVSPVNNRPVGLREKFARYGFPLLASSDSHYLSEIGRARSRFMVESLGQEEIVPALRRQGNRSVTLA